MSHSAKDARRPLKPFAQQIDLDGRLHDQPLPTEAMRLFEPAEPAPAQIAGQTDLDLEPNE